MEDRWVWFRRKIWSCSYKTASRTNRPASSKLPRSWSNSDNGKTRSSTASWIFTKPLKLSCPISYQRCIGQSASSTSWNRPWEHKLSTKASLKIVKNWLVPFEGPKRYCRHLSTTRKTLFRRGEEMLLSFRTLSETLLFPPYGLWHRLTIQWGRYTISAILSYDLVAILLMLTFKPHRHLVASFLANRRR